MVDKDIRKTNGYTMCSVTLSSECDETTVEDRRGEANRGKINKKPLMYIENSDLLPQ